MAISQSFRTVLRTLRDALFGLALFVIFAFAISAYNRTSITAYPLTDILALSSSAGDLIKFSLKDSPLIATAVIATAAPAPRVRATRSLPPTPPQPAFVLLAGIFSALVAFNLAFFRHLRREYASPR